MEGESRSLTSKTCDSCKALPATVFCRADSAFLCLACDVKVHAANKLASRHARVWVCDVCEQAPSAVTCKSDAAVLCAACDRDIHTANPLARRHERLPVVPFYDSASAKNKNYSSSSAITCDDVFSEEEVEAASWLLPDPNGKSGDGLGSPEYNKSVEYLFSDVDPYLDLDLISGEEKPKLHHVLNLDLNHQEKLHYSADGVVPVQGQNEFESGRIMGPVVDGLPAYDMGFQGSKFLLYGFNSQSISQSVSSSSLDVGVVPEDSTGTMADATNSFVSNEAVPVPVSGIDREARVSRYREKRKNRKFEKTIRYASRKAYAEARPRIKGRFAKRVELEVDSFIASHASYCVVPSF